jgi:hypothetical protein
VHDDVMLIKLLTLWMFYFNTVLEIHFIPFIIVYSTSLLNGLILCLSCGNGFTLTKGLCLDARDKLLPVEPLQMLLKNVVTDRFETGNMVTVNPDHSIA